ncbi:MAG: class I SAM-dependent methyltransferase [Desulfobacterales bacterium]|nr:class I SAM-dependent methyltransferase [Desulfobacterales bacterium]
MSEWFENESLWIETYPLVFTEERFKLAEEQIDKVTELTNITGGSALDLCCGPGRCSFALERKGFSVTGVDITTYLLDKAKARAKEEDIDIEWVQEDMREFVRPGSFDLVINMFTSFGYFDNKNDDIVVLKNILASLKPGGAFLIDIVSKEWVAGNIRNTISLKLPNDGLLVQRHEIFDEWTRIRNEWIIIRGESAKTINFHHTIYSGQELRDRLENVGFADVRLFGSLDGNEYGIDSERLIAVAYKEVGEVRSEK